MPAPSSDPLPDAAPAHSEPSESSRIRARTHELLAESRALRAESVQLKLRFHQELNKSWAWRTQWLQE